MNNSVQYSIFRNYFFKCIKKVLTYFTEYVIIYKESEVRQLIELLELIEKIISLLTQIVALATAIIGYRLITKKKGDE